MPDIKLRDGSGVENTYVGVDTITLPLADGSGNWTFGLTDEDLTYGRDEQEDDFVNIKLAKIFTKYNLWGRVSFIPWEFNTGSGYNITLNFPAGMDTTEDLTALTVDCTDATNGFYITFNGAEKLKYLPNIINANNFIYWEFGNYYGNISKEELYRFIKQFENCKYTNKSSPSSSSSNVFGFRFSNSIDADDIDDTLQIAHSIYNKDGSEYYNGNSMSSSIDFTSRLSEVNCFPFIYKSSIPITSNVWSTYSTKYFLKELKFCTNNGIPYEVKWKSQNFDFGSSSYPIGYSINSVNSEIQRQKRYKISDHNIFYKDKELTTLEEVQARYNELKNGRWYAQSSRQITYEGASRYMSLLFSRYNHDSAVNTINSLPDTSAYLATAGGTNTIKFKNYQGALTDGGGINDLTPAEIQVATDKGWTVTIVN